MNQLRTIKALKAISITSFLLIILKDQMIGVPTFIWLIGSALTIGEISQIYSLLAIAGIFWNIKAIHKERTLKNILFDSLSFILILYPMVNLLISFPLEFFNFLLFILPFSLFVLLYLFSIGLSLNVYFKNKRVQI
jgi:hypothetical protein